MLDEEENSRSVVTQLLMVLVLLAEETKEIGRNRMILYWVATGIVEVCYKECITVVLVCDDAGYLFVIFMDVVEFSRTQ